MPMIKFDFTPIITEKKPLIEPESLEDELM
jgi:hypothetical protein